MADSGFFGKHLALTHLLPPVAVAGVSATDRTHDLLLRYKGQIIQTFPRPPLIADEHGGSRPGFSGPASAKRSRELQTAIPRRRKRSHTRKRCVCLEGQALG